MDRRATFDRAALNIITYLERFQECKNVNFQCSDGTASHESLLWEKRNAPFHLPSDLKNFYTLFNGVNLTWTVEIGDRAVDIGIVRVNRLDQLVRIPVDGAFQPNIWNDVEVDAPDPQTSAAFLLDSQPDTVGNIALLYRNCAPTTRNSSEQVRLGVVGEGESGMSGGNGSSEEPEVWLVDRSARWHFVSQTFTHFFRLMVAHCGIRGWLLAFTPEGLPSVTQQWMNMFCKERLIIDKAWHDRISRTHHHHHHHHH